LHDLFIIGLHDFSYQISLPLLSVCLSRVVCFPFAMITYSMGADVVAQSKALLEDEEPSFFSLRRRFPVGGLIVVSLSIEFISLV